MQHFKAILGAVVLLALAGCVSTPPNIEVLQLTPEQGMSEKTIEGVTIKVQYLDTASWDVIRGDKAYAGLSVPTDKIKTQIAIDGASAYWSSRWQYGEETWFFPLLANTSAFYVTITNNTPATIKLKDIRISMLTPEGDAYISLNRQEYFDLLAEISAAEISIQRSAVSANWQRWLGQYVGQCAIKYGWNPLLKFITTDTGEISPGATVKGYVFIYGGLTYEPKDGSVVVTDGMKLRFTDFPVAYDTAGNITNKTTFEFPLTKALSQYVKK